MKIVCDNCTTKYQIADEKVSGKAFKIRCKKCGHVIVVNKSPGEPSSAQPPEAGAAPADAAPPAAEPAAGGDAVWHLVIDREQVGPMTAEEVKAKIKGGQVDAETYGWKEGFDDWLKLSVIDNFKGDFVSRGSDDQATRRAEPATLVQQPEQPAASPGADLFGSAPAQQPHRAASPAAPTLMGDAAQAEALAARNSVEPPMSSGQESEALGSGKGMMGARSENSVLFSLNNLSALAGANENQGRSAPSSSAQDKPGYANVASEASGLIDIRAMAAATLQSNNYGGPSSNRGGPDLMMGADAAPVFAPVATNMLMPSAEPQGIPKWVFALVGVGGLAIVGMIVFLVIYLQSSPPAQPVVATGPTPGVTTPAANTGTPTGTTTGTPATDPGTKSAAGSPQGTTTTSPTTKPTAPESGSSGGSSKRKDKGDKADKGEKPSKASKEPAAKAEKEPEIPAPPPKAEAPVKKEKPPAKKDDLDSLLDGASAGNGGKPKAEAKKDLPEQLSRDQISSGFKSANMGACKSEGASGTYMVKLTIGKSGKISDANVVSGGDGKDCVAKAVKGAKFPEFSGDPMSLTYPFIVR